MLRNRDLIRYQTLESIVDNRKTPGEGSGAGETLLVGGLLLAFAALVGVLLYVALS